jgi:hypothetical protein
MKVVGGSEIYNFPIHHFVHFYSKFLRKTWSNTARPTQEMQPAHPPPRACQRPRQALPPRRPHPGARLPNASHIPKFRAPRCLVPRVARASRARPGGPLTASARRTGRGQAAVRAGLSGRGRLNREAWPSPCVLVAYKAGSSLL